MAANVSLTRTGRNSEVDLHLRSFSVSSCVGSLVVEVTEPPAKYLKYLSNTEEDGDDGEGVHGAEEDGLLKVFWHHALRHIKGLFQSTGITHVQWVDLEEEDEHQMVKSSATQ